MRRHIGHAGDLLVRNLERQGLWPSDGAQEALATGVDQYEVSLP